MKTNGTLDRVLDSDMDSRRMCFEQGKAFVFMPSEDGDVIIAEEPNGAVEHRQISDGAVNRIWPDGRVDHFRRGDPDDLAYPYILHPAKRQVASVVAQLTIVISANGAGKSTWCRRRKHPGSLRERVQGASQRPRPRQVHGWNRSPRGTEGRRLRYPESIAPNELTSGARPRQIGSLTTRWGHDRLRPVEGGKQPYGACPGVALCPSSKRG